MEQIGVDELKRRLEAGEPVAVIDIRESREFEAWHIHGSRNLPVYDALKRGDDLPLTERGDDLPRDVPVVAVCRAGILSRRAAQVLQSMGIQALSLAGGMRGWGAVWSEAPLASDEHCRLLQIRRNGKGCLSYLLGAQGTGAVVDPCVDAEVYVQRAAHHGLALRYVVETHVHADHVSRARELCALSGAQLIMPANERVQFPFRAMHDGDTLDVGGVAVVALATPGHTGESMCYRVDERFLLSGDTLFVNNVGRPDLEQGDAGAREGARRLYRSLRERVLNLPDDLQVAPGHHGRPLAFDGRPVVDELAEIRSRLDVIRASEREFVETIVGRLGSKPPNYEAVLAINEGREQPDGVDLLDIEAGPNSCAAH